MKKPHSPIATTLSLIGVFAPAVVMAHPGHDSSAGLIEGALHPLAGVDHLLAMLAVGIWALRLGGRAKWLAPAVFISFMTMGALLGAYGVMAAHIELFVAASVALLGVGIVFASRIPLSVGLAVIAVSALLHGCVHGAEAAGQFGVPYLSGMLAATLALHLAGMGTAALVKRRFGEQSVRWFGMPIAFGGIAMLVGVA